MALRPNQPQSSDDQKAERKAAQQDVFLREVDDALRQDEMLGVFKRYGRPIGLVVALGLAIFAGVLWWNNHQATQAGERGEQMTLALDDLDQNKIDPARQAVADAEPGRSAAGPKAAAQMLRAGIALQQGKRDEALKLYARSCSRHIRAAALPRSRDDPRSCRQFRCHATAAGNRPAEAAGGAG